MMGELSTTFQIESVSITLADVRSMLLLLDSPEHDAVIHVLEWFIKYADQSMRNRLHLLNMRIVPLLLKLSSVRNGQIKKLVTGLIGTISETNDLHSDLRNTSLIQRLIILLATEEHVEVQEEAAFSLGQLARDYSNKSEIRKSGGMKALLKLLSVNDPDVKKNAAFALNNLLDDYASRTELRLLNGFNPILELLHAEYPEIIENALHCLMRCSEDIANRVEIRRASGLKRLLAVLEHSVPQVVCLALSCLANCLEDGETNMTIAENNGIQNVVQLLSASDPKVKYNAEFVLYKIAKYEKNIGYIRESGAIPLLIANLNLPISAASTSDSLIISNSALAMSSLAKNEMNQNDFIKAGTIDVLVKLLGTDNSDIKKAALMALSSLCAHSPKVRAKIRSIDGVKAIINALQTAHAIGKDVQLLVNAVECICSLAEDAADRVEITRLSGIQLLVSVLKHNDLALNNVSAMALARCLQDIDARQQFYECKGGPAIFHLLSVDNEEVCKNSAWALSNASLSEVIALEACNLGALENLLKLTNSPSKTLSSFALDALEKILNFHLPAKYWLRNRLLAGNLVKDDFFDLGSAGSNSEMISGFPSIQQLKINPIDTKREVIVVNWLSDAPLNDLYSLLLKATSEELPQYSNSKVSFVRSILVNTAAKLVSHHLGGCIERSREEDIQYKIHISELKVSLNSNVIPLGLVRRGTFYHRALLFKALLDKVQSDSDDHKQRASEGQSDRTSEISILSELRNPPSRISLNRGDYGRAWNTVFLKPYEAEVTRVVVDDPLLALGEKEEEYIVDLMYTPGRLIHCKHGEAESYMRI